ncbi:hypothetical protein DFS34DRAFT_598035, partial [Phlyctochytrium arcticum]
DVADLRDAVKTKWGEAPPLKEVAAGSLLVYANAEALKADKDEAEPKHFIDPGDVVGLYAFDFTAASDRTEDRQIGNSFRAELTTSYGLSTNPTTIKCSLLGISLPANNVIAAHIFPRKWSHSLYLLEIDDVDDPRNGIFLYKPIEHALDSGWITFVFSPKSNQFHCQVLYKGLLTVDVDAEARKRLGNRYIPTQIPVSRTFQDLHSQPLIIPSSHNVWKRVFAFHAVLARHHAIKKRWILPTEFTEIESDEAWSPTVLDGPWRATVEAWQAQL